MDKLKSFIFSPPSFEDSVKDNVARWTFTYIWLAWLTYAALYLLVVPNLNWSPEQTALATKLLIAGALIDLILFFLLRFGLVQFATWVHFALIYVLAVIALINLGGIRGPILTFFFAFITVSVTFVHERLTLFVAASSVAALGAAYYLEISGYIEPYPQNELVPREIFLAAVIFLIVAATQAFLSIKDLRIERDEAADLATKLQRKYVELDKKKTELEKSRRELEQRVLDRTHELANVNTSLLDQADELTEAKDKAEEADALKSAFLASMSHEIRTPLTSIIGTADVLREEISEENRDLVEIIFNGGQRLMSTLNSVLDLAQLEGRARKLNRETIDVLQRTEDTVGIFASRAEQKNLKLKVKPNGSGPYLSDLDKAAYDRIIQNLVGNSLKFTEKGGIEVKVDGQEDHIRISVKDTGMGIGEEYLPKLFDRFSQESSGEARTFEGNGLGLAITKNLVEMMEGSIDVESVEGKGSTFSVQFPRTEE